MTKRRPDAERRQDAEQLRRQFQPLLDELGYAELSAIPLILRDLGRSDIADAFEQGDVDKVAAFFDVHLGIAATTIRKLPLPELRRLLQEKRKRRPPKSPGRSPDPQLLKLGEFAYQRMKRNNPPPPEGEPRWTDRLIGEAFRLAHPNSPLLFNNGEEIRRSELTRMVKNARQKYAARIKAAKETGESP